MATKLKDTGTITVTPLHPAIGAEIGGVDLSLELSAATIEAVRKAWYDHSVLLFRDQENFTGEDQLRFAGHFGEVAERHKPKPGASAPSHGADWVNLMPITDKKDEDGTALGGLGHGEMWFHSDKCYHQAPHRASFLYGIEIPTEGGHTKYSSMYGAYENLPAEWKERFKDSFVMQGYDYGCDERLNLNIDLNNIFHYRQPMCLKNPGSGRIGLYVSRLNTMWIEGIDRDESEEILNKMFEIAEDPAIVYEHVWRPNDLLMWDNLACHHARTTWPDEQTRELRRCTTNGAPLY
jgi:taurine dioxygenase